jgi:opacity protein-like surface antigen
MMLVWGLASTQMRAQTDIALSGYAALNQSTSTSSVVQHPASQGGYLIQLRHVSNPIEGFEVNYGFNRANQRYIYTGSVCPAFGCSTQTASIPADAHEVTADWVVSLKVLMVRPFAFAGGGFLVTVPKGGTLTTSGGCGTQICTTTTVAAPTRTETKGLFTYGAGLDFTVIPHIGFRFQYRGRVSKAPDVVTAFSSTDRFARTSEPVFGVFLSF